MIPFRRKPALSLAAVGLFFAGAATLHSASLVDGFNVTVFNNFTSQYTDVGGTLAVGNNLNLTGYALNQGVPNPNPAPASGGFDTVVGGAFSFQGGTIYGKVSAASATVTGSTVCSGCVVTGHRPLTSRRFRPRCKIRATSYMRYRRPARFQSPSARCS